MKVTIFSDGSCWPNPGPSGYAAVAMIERAPTKTYAKVFSGHAADSTNNRAELHAVIAGLGALTRQCDVVLYTDSKYVQNGITKWIAKWQTNGWKTADKEPVKNQDLWKKLLSLNRLHNIDWRWVKGHTEDETEEAFWNGIVDEIAGWERKLGAGK